MISTNTINIACKCPVTLFYCYRIKGIATLITRSFTIAVWVLNTIFVDLFTLVRCGSNVGLYYNSTFSVDYYYLYCLSVAMQTVLNYTILSFMHWMVFSNWSLLFIFKNLFFFKHNRKTIVTLLTNLLLNVYTHPYTNTIGCSYLLITFSFVLFCYLFFLFAIVLLN